jgi:hypothetical protein
MYSPHTFEQLLRHVWYAEFTVGNAGGECEIHSAAATMPLPDAAAATASISSDRS